MRLVRAAIALATVSGADSSERCGFMWISASHNDVEAPFLGRRDLREGLRKRLRLRLRLGRPELVKDAEFHDAYPRWTLPYTPWDGLSEAMPPGYFPRRHGGLGEGGGDNI